MVRRTIVKDSLEAPTHAHINSVIESILHAEPCEEADRAKIKWPKRKRKFKVVRGRTTTKPKPRRRPVSYEYRSVLEQNGTNLNVCAVCKRKGKCHVHHLDGNPWNNVVENLKPLCWRCHQKVHGISHEGVIDEFSLVPLDEICW